MIGRNNHIHPTAIIHGDAIIGDNNWFGPFTVIGPGVTIGHSNRFEGHCSIGTPAEHKSYFYENGYVNIGDYNVIREFVTINSGTAKETSVGNRCTFLRGTHVGHDSVVEDDVTVSCNVLIGGHSHIMKFANLGLGAILHQYSVIGTCAMLGMGTIVTKKTPIKPGWIYVGNPAEELKMNEVGVERAKISTEDMMKEIDRYGTLL